MSADRDFLSEEEATRLWQRAAQLQVEAARRAEEARAVEDAGTEEAGEPAHRSDDGYALTHVRAAAVEAGISEEFVETALAEVQAERVLPRASRSWTGRLAARVLGDPPPEIVRRRTMRATPEQVLQAMEAILPFEPFTVTLRDRHGDPAAGGLMVFDIQGVGLIQGLEAGGFKKDASFADLRELYVTLNARTAGSSGETEMTVRAPTAWAWSINAAAGGLFGALGGGLGIGAGIGVSVALGVLGPVGAGIVVALTGGSGGAGGIALLRLMYRHGIHRGEVALDAVLSAVALKAEGGWGISSSDAPASLPRG